MIWSETLTDKTGTIDLNETIAFLEPTQEHAGAICMSSDDWNTMKTDLEKACRYLGNHCTVSMKATISAMDRQANPSSPESALGGGALTHGGLGHFTFR